MKLIIRGNSILWARIILMLIFLNVSSCVTGMALGFKFTQILRRPRIFQGVITAASTSEDNRTTILLQGKDIATVQHDLGVIESQNQASIDDRSHLHEQVNTLITRVDVDEAKIWTVLSCISACGILANIVLTILTVMDRISRKALAERP